MLGKPPKVQIGHTVLLLMTTVVWRAEAQKILTVFHPQPFAGVYDAIQAPWMGLQTADLIANVSSSQSESCDPAPAGRPWCVPPHRIAVLSGDTNCAWETRARNARASGCTIVIGRTLGQLGGVLGGPYQFDGTDVSALSEMALVNVGPDDYDRLTDALTAARRSGGDLALRLKYTPSDRKENAWVRLWTSVPFRVFMWGIIPLFSLLCAGETLRRVVLFAMDLRATGVRGPRGYNASFVPTIVLSIELVGWVCRVVQCVDFLWSTHILPRDVHQTLFTLSFPFVLISSACLVLAWRDVLAKSSVTTPSLVRLRVPLLIFAATIIGMDVSLAILRIFYITAGGFNASAISAVIYFLYQLVVGLVFTIYGSRVVGRLRKRSRTLSVDRSRSRSGSALQKIKSMASGRSVTSHDGGIESMQSRRQIALLTKMTKFLIASSVAMVFSAFTGVLIGTSLIRQPYGLVGVFVATIVFINIQAFARSLVFSLPSERRNAANRSSSVSQMPTSTASSSMSQLQA